MNSVSLALLCVILMLLFAVGSSEGIPVSQPSQKRRTGCIPKGGQAPRFLSTPYTARTVHSYTTDTLYSIHMETSQTHCLDHTEHYYIIYYVHCITIHVHTCPLYIGDTT